MALIRKRGRVAVATSVLLNTICFLVVRRAIAVRPVRPHPRASVGRLAGQTFPRSPLKLAWPEAGDLRRTRRESGPMWDRNRFPLRFLRTAFPSQKEAKWFAILGAILTLSVFNAYDVRNVCQRTMVARRQYLTLPRRVSNLGMDTWDRSILLRMYRRLSRAAGARLLLSLRMRKVRPCRAGRA